MKSVSVFGMRLDRTNYEDAVAQICDWAERGESKTVVCANVHVAMEAHDSPEFQAEINQADLVTPDGMPLVWLLRAIEWLAARRGTGPL